MTTALGPARATGTASGDFIARVRDFLPRIAALAPAMEQAGRLDDRLVADMDRAGIFSAMIPRRWGGAGLGMAEAAEIVRLIASADACTAWNASFYMFNHLLLARFPMSAQERLFADKASFLCAGIWAPLGSTERVEGGFLLSGRWSYASGIYQAEGALLPAMADGEPCWLAVKRADVDIIDDWNVAAMKASGSATVVATGVFVPDDQCMPIARLVSARDHHGVGHAESVNRYPFTRFGIVSAALAIGVLETGVANGREKLASSRPYGVARIDRPWSRMRWAEAAQTLRMLQLLHRDALATTIDRCERDHDWTQEEIGQLSLDSVSIYHGAKDALRDLVDYCGGSSIHKSDEQLQRMARDIAMIATHLLMGDYEVLWERGSRLVLGLPAAPGEAI